jgi:hypothetical protein
LGIRIGSARSRAFSTTGAGRFDLQDLLELAPKYWHATRGRLRPEGPPLSGFEVPPINEIIAAAAGVLPG